MNRNLKIAVILTAIDQMTSVVNGAVNGSIASLNRFQEVNKKFAQGFALLGAGQAGFNLLRKPIEDFAELEEAGARLKANMLTRDGALDPALWKKVSDEAIRLGNKLPGHTADFYRMFTVMKQLGIEEQTILNGAGEAAAAYANVTGASYEHVAEMLSRVRNAINISDADSIKFMDTMARINNIGVNIDDMTMAFGRSSGALKFLGIQGEENLKKISVAYAMFMRGGTGGYTTGTNFARMMTSMLKPDKYKEMQQAAKKYGVDGLNFLDKGGNFAGVDNMLQQFDKLKNLSTAAISDILKPLTGLEGLDDQMAKTLAKGGLAEYTKLMGKIDAQAGIMVKQDTQLNTLNAQWERLNGTLKNAKAAFGEALKPALDKILSVLNSVAEATQKWVQANPELARIAAILISVVSAGLMLAGVIKIIQGVIAVFRILNITMLMNPFVLVAMAAIAAVILIITYWDKIKLFFTGLWEKIKQIFARAWEFIKKIFFSVNPIGIIIKNWAPISDFFTNLWANVKNTFMGWVNYVMGLGSRFLEAGKNIVLNIWNGIKAMANKPIEAIQEIMTKMRDYLPFSPAKVGPLRDIHRIQLVETIAANIKAGPMVDAMNRAMGGLNNSMQQGPGIGVGGGAQHFHFSPVINLQGGATNADAARLMDGLQPAMEKWWRDKMRGTERRSF